MDFNDVHDKTPTQEFEIVEDRNVGEYAVKYICVHLWNLASRSENIRGRTAKFSNISSVTIFIPANRGAEATRIYYVGFLGQWTEVRDPLIDLSVVLIVVTSEKGTQSSLFTRRRQT